MQGTTRRAGSAIRMWTAAFAALAGAALAGCGAEPDATDVVLFSARDSAGVTIVENRRPPEGSRLPWQLSAGPVTSIGTLEGDEAYQLYQVSDAIKLDDGRILVVNRGTQQIRVYDEAGTHLASWGREGEGPGEFTALSNVDRWAGDSIVGWDFRQGRMTVLDGEGTLGRTFRLEGIEGASGLSFVSTLPSGEIFASGNTRFTAGETPSGVRRPDRGYALLNAEGAVVGELGSHPGSEAYVVATETFMSVTTHPFARRAVGAVWRDLMILDGTDDFEIEAYRPDASLARLVRLEHAARAPVEGDLEAWVERRLSALAPEERTRNELFYEDLPLLPSFPAFVAVMVDALGYLWVDEFDLPGDEERHVWVVFDPDGRIEGYVETPADLAIFEIGADYVLGSTTDDFDVEYVQLWSLSRPTT